jgi:tRNA (guanine26-N2/guanine27-N2)-dimethyltransferase
MSNSSSSTSTSQPSTNTATSVPVVPTGHELITEGTITMVYPKSENSVFYNPVQVQNRDLSVLMIGMYAERRMEKMWTTKKRKEIRKKMMSAESALSKNSTTAETKEERKARLAKFEQDLENQVALEKSTVNFTKLTQESSSCSSQCNEYGMTIFEALAASGLRSLRYWKEVPGIRSIVVNDLDPVAVDMARENVIRNGLAKDLVVNEKEDATFANNGGVGEDIANQTNAIAANTTTALRHVRPRGIQLQVGDATHEMYMSRLPPDLYLNQCNNSNQQQQLHHPKPQYDVIDLDPYGSAAPFMDAAMQSVVSGGLLAVTCTDMAALGGSHPETCYGRYGAFPIQRSGYLQELALRILLYHMSVVAARYGRCIRPVLSVGMAFYCRVFVEVYDDKAGVSALGHLLTFLIILFHLSFVIQLH